jgi:hypothetical protein
MPGIGEAAFFVAIADRLSLLLPDTLLLLRNQRQSYDDDKKVPGRLQN